MIDRVLKYLAQQLNQRFNGATSSDPVVVMPETAPSDSVSFADNKVTLLLLRTEEERTMRQDDPWLRQKIEVVRENNRETINKTVKRMAPPILLHLYVLLVSRNTSYGTAMSRLSDIIRFFQAQRVFDKDSEGWPQELYELPELRVELHSPTFTTMNEIWSMLKAPLHPSVMYKLTLTLLEDEEPVDGEYLVKTTTPGRRLADNQDTIDNSSPVDTDFVNPL